MAHAPNARRSASTQASSKSIHLGRRAGGMRLGFTSSQNPGALKLPIRVTGLNDHRPRAASLNVRSDVAITDAPAGGGLM